MTEAFTDTLYSRAKTSSSVHQKAVFFFSRARQQINLPGIMLSKKLPSCPAPCDSASLPPESWSLYQRFLGPDRHCHRQSCSMIALSACRSSPWSCSSSPWWEYTVEYYVISGIDHTYSTPPNNTAEKAIYETIFKCSHHGLERRGDSAIMEPTTDSNGEGTLRSWSPPQTRTARGQCDHGAHHGIEQRGDSAIT